MTDRDKKDLEGWDEFQSMTLTHAPEKNSIPGIINYVLAAERNAYSLGRTSQAAEITRLNERVGELTEHLGEAKDHRDALTTRLRDLLTDPLQDPQPIENELRFIGEQRKKRAALNTKDQHNDG